MTTIGFIGAGKIGSQLARLAVANGFDVILSNSRGPESLGDLVAELGPRATAATTTEAGDRADIVVVTIPVAAIRDVPVEPLAGKIVIDTGNYYPERDGNIAELDDESTTTGELLERHLPHSRIVKAFNTIEWRSLTAHGEPRGSANRRALPVAGDDPEAKQTVVELLDTFGFDAVDAGPLAESWRFQRDTPGYITRRTAAEVAADLAAARRYRDQ
jgi:predicted dinucleotide-binding enzyme